MRQYSPPKKLIEEGISHGIGVKQFLDTEGVEWSCPSEADGSVHGECPKELEKELKDLGLRIIQMKGDFKCWNRGEKFEFSFFSPVL